MKSKVAFLILTIVVLVCVSFRFTQTVSSNSINRGQRSLHVGPNSLNLPFFVTTFDVDRTDDTAAASTCSVAPNDCSLRGAIIAANANVSADPVVINLQAGQTYNLTLTNGTQENAAATGDLDITTTVHTVTIVGGGSSGLNASIIDAASLTSGTMHDRVFQITGSAVSATFQDLVIQNGSATDDGTNGASTNAAAQNSDRAGGGILNNGGSVTLNNVVVQNCQALGKGDSIVNQHTTLEGRGGGVASVTITGNVVVTNSKFSGNTAQGGNGGNFNNGDGSGAKGGSIYFEGGTLNISGTTIEASQANGGNGGNQNQDGQTNGGFGGLAQGGGVWIAASGTVTINNSTFDDTEANGGNSGTGGNGANPAGNADGGGIYSLGNLTVTNSTFHLAEANGGDGGDAFGSTCLGAHNGGDGGAARGGAILADGGTLIVNTATFANNSAHGGNGGDGGQTNGACGMHGAGGLAYGGAMTNSNGATINMKHGTLSLNDAQAGNTGVNQGGANKPPRLVAEGTGGGIRVGPAVTLENTIIDANTAANGLGDTTGAPVPGPNVDGAVTSNGHNLIGVSTEATGFSSAGDLTGANSNLAALADNGGPTRTMEPQTGSDALDAGVAAGATLDQRGEVRTVDDPTVVDEPTSDGTDIGAFETSVPCILTCPTNITAPSDPDVCGAVVIYIEPSGETCGTVTCDHPSGSFFPVGTTLVTCTSSVGPTCSFNVTVNDTQGPTITLGAPITLWPPNHKYSTVNVADLVTSVTDNCDSTVGVGSVLITSVSSDEPENSNGDGNTLDDIAIANDCKSVQLRAERKGSGNGRVYTIALKVTDAVGNISTATAKVRVPQSQNGVAAVDDGPSYTVLSSCP